MARSLEDEYRAESAVDDDVGDPEGEELRLPRLAN
jgi:hypothetical protein